jgi:hypothetical protein
VPVLETVRGMRVVADPAALDVATWSAAAAEPVTVLRFAPDEAFAIGAATVQVADPDAIVEDERGLVGAWCTFEDLRARTEWSPPTERPVLAQGAVAGVPAKVWLPDDGSAVLLLASAAHADVLAERLGWPR